MYPSNTRFVWPTRVCLQNGMTIGSAIFTTHSSDQHTEGHTGRRQRKEPSGGKDQAVGRAGKCSAQCLAKRLHSFFPV